ncbi:glucosyltransferase [Rhodotorula kratochvilovae]
MKMGTGLELAGYSAWVAGMVVVAVAVNRAVPEPYMDEIFHVPQAQAYCRGDWSYWDPALTTPPGLYLVPAALAHVKRALPSIFHLLPNFDPCAVASLRALNLLISLTLPFIYTKLLVLLSAHATPHNQSSARWVIALFPLLGWWSWMYYTDMGSIVAVLLCWKAGLQGRFARSLGAVSLLFRQTNIVWLAFVAAQAAISEVKRQSLLGQAGAVTDPLLADVTPVDLIRTPFSLALAAVSHLPSLFPLLGAYLPVFGAAAAFVKWNGGIVLGDKANHVPTIHIAQVYYCIAFAGVFFSPHLISVGKVKATLRSLFGSVGRVLVTLIVLAIVCWTIKNYTIAHPFLLADNRHYAFYLWRRVINVHPLARYVLAPGYLFAATLIWHALARARTMHLSTLILFLGATIAVLLPTPLLEPRYFLLPLIVLRLYLAPTASSCIEDGTAGAPPHKRNHAALRRRRARSPPSSPRFSRQRLALEAALYLAIHALCIWLFLARPFYWDVRVGADGRGLDGRDEREVGRVQRFMW